MELRTKFSITGNPATLVVDTTTRERHPALKLEVKLKERDGDGGFDLDVARAVVDEETVAGALGLTVALPPQASGGERAKELDNVLRTDPAKEWTPASAAVKV